MIIQTKDLGKRYNREWVFRHASLRFESGKSYGITGSNGAGKSTLLRVLWGQLPASEGEVSYQYPDSTLNPDEWYSKVAIAAPYMDLVDEFTLGQLISFHFRLRNRGGAVSDKEMLDRMELGHARHKPLKDFSSGMKQRVKLGLALLSASEALFLDEPTTNLDEQAMSWYHHLLTQQSLNRIVIIASNVAEDFPTGSELIDVRSFKRLPGAG
ncbi:MAG: ABC transporter ATP-binding protein [Cyclobacteriaceae bacterium]